MFSVYSKGAKRDSLSFVLGLRHEEMNLKQDAYQTTIKILQVNLWNAVSKKVLAILHLTITYPQYTMCCKLKTIENEGKQGL